MQNDKENSVTSDADKEKSEADRYIAALYKRASELQDSGLSRSVAFGTAELEARIARWPAQWGNDLHALIYGDFDPPDHDLSYPQLGITIERGKRTNTIITTALCVVNARVQVRDKSLSAVLDAAARLNTFLGIWTIVDWGNRGIGWWCHLTSGTIAGAGGPFEKDGIEKCAVGIEQLPSKVKRKVRAALHCIREPKQMMMEGFKSDTLRVYAGYWNAFECLVDAVSLIRPHTKMTRQQKVDGIRQFISERKGDIDLASFAECYRSYVDPGFIAKASHALRECCAKRADGYINECFRAEPEQERLYAVRNAINHGDIDPDSLQEIMRVEEKLWRLKMIVFGMLGQLIPFSYPVDSGPR